ncbi:hypothetical protein GCM10010255_78590 [Streptomyces coeruleofuscus]|uniref:Uncharacterized protein n=1 Tax=Streptomyces coeruleofuscus TaxID=66879 RepID=A0ABN3JB72_9ACTN
MIEGEAQRDIASAIVAGKREPAMAEGTHHLHHVAGDGPLGVSRVICGRCRSYGAPVPAKIGTDDGETPLDEKRGDAMPGGRGAGVAMQQHYRRPFPAMANKDRSLIDPNPRCFETLEQGPNLPPSHTRPCRRSAYTDERSTGPAFLLPPRAP